MNELKLKIGDDVSLNAKVIGLSESHNPILQFKSGIKVLVRITDINTWHPNVESDGIDHRKGN